MIAAWFWLIGPTATGLLLWGLWRWARNFYYVMMTEYWLEIARRAMEREQGRPVSRDEVGFPTVWARPVTK